MDKKKILGFAGSNSSKSINKQLVTYSGTLLKRTEFTLLDLNDYELPIYGMDAEAKDGIPMRAQEFKELLSSHDGIIISMAEHNGSYSAVFKNLFDWISRLEGKAWDDKPMLLLATSPGKRGGASVLSAAANRFPYNGGLVVNTFSLPSFFEYFDKENGVTDPEKDRELKEKVSALEESLGV